MQQAISGIKGLQNVLPVHIVSLARNRIDNLTAPAADQEGILAVAFCAATHKSAERAREIMALPHMVERNNDAKWVGLTQGCGR